jgi:hypothetical protein
LIDRVPLENTKSARVDSLRHAQAANASAISQRNFIARDGAAKNAQKLKL